MDSTLERRADGSIGPKAAVVDLRFSDGGDGDGIIHLGGRSGSLTLDWPTALPVPTLSEDTATYSEVFDGVDLQLTATPEGYREVLVVKTAEAATNPALAQIKLDVHADGLRVVAGAGGGISALDENGNAIFKGPAGLMWDSAGASASSASPQMVTTKTVGSVSSSQATSVEEVGEQPEDKGVAPSKGDASAVLPVQVHDGAVSVAPDLGLLRGTSTVYPVYIDPPLGLGYSERTVLSSDGDRFWQFNGEYGVGHCGSADGYYCGNNYTNRMYYEFAPTKLAGKKILDATFRAYETWSFNCDAHWVDLVRTDNISEATRWPGPTQRDWMGDRYVSNGRGDLCSPSQPKSWVEFNDNPAEPDENLTPAVQALADGRIARLTLMLRAKDEGDPRAWKRFNQNAELQIQYVPKPGVPTQVGVIPGDGTTAYCEPEAKPTIVTRADPIVQAAVQTQVQPASGEYQGALRSFLSVEKKGADGKWGSSWSATSPSTGYHVDNTLEKVRISAREDGALYRLRALTQSHWTYAGVTSSASSSYSPSSWCYFKMDTTAPKAPQITPAEGNPYTCTAAATCAGTGGPGVVGKFKLTPNTSDKDIEGYRWYLQDPRTVRETDPAQPASEAVVDVTPRTGGTLTLVVEARDVRKRWGPKAEYSFKVALPAGPTGEWRFSEGTGTTAANTSPDGSRQPVTLYTQSDAAATWSVQSRRGEGDHSLRLNDDLSDPAKRVGYATTPIPVNTANSFTVSTWVMLTDASSTRAVLAAPGTNGVAFTVYYSAGDKKWVLNRTNHDGTTGLVAIRSVADYTNPPVNVWTHLAGVFSTGTCTQAPCANGQPVEADDTLQLFVNGRPQGSPVNLKSTSSTYQPWSVTGDMQIGRARVSGAYTQYFMGRIDETKVWQRALDEEDLRWESALKTDNVAATELVGQWKADTAATGATTISESTPYPAGDLKLTNATVDSDGVVALNGTSAYLSTTGPVTDESASFTVTAFVKLDSAKLADKPVGYRAQVFGQATPAGGQSSWALWVEKLEANTFVWRFGRTAVDGTGKVVATAVVGSDDVAVLDDGVQITGVYDATEMTDSGSFGKLHLFLSDAEQVTDTAAADFSAYGQGSGELAAGRGAAAGTVGHYLPGSMSDVRVWAGAMSANQISAQVLLPVPTA